MDNIKGTQRTHVCPRAAVGGHEEMWEDDDTVLILCTLMTSLGSPEGTWEKNRKGWAKKHTGPISADFEIPLCEVRGGPFLLHRPSATEPTELDSLRPATPARAPGPSQLGFPDV